MSGNDRNTVCVTKDSSRKHDKFELVPKENGEDGHEKQISCDEATGATEEITRKQKKGRCNEVKDVLSIAQICYQADNCECRSNSSTTSSERKRKSANLLDSLMPKKQKHCMNSPDVYADLNSIDTVSDGFDIQREEKSGSSGKRSRDSYYSEFEGEAFSGDDSAAKRRKVGHASNNIQLKMLGPLKLPDYVKGFKYDYEIGPEIIKLNKQLLEINNKLRNGGTVDNLLEEEQSPSPPVYNEIGIRVNTEENRLRAKLGRRRQQIICELNQKNPLLRLPSDAKPSKIFRKLYIPVKQYPNYNFIGLIIGPRGHTQKRMERESGARILLRGKGSTRLRKTKQSSKDPKTEPVEDEDLHVYIEAEDEKSLEMASEMVEKLLVPVNEEVNEHKHAQLRELAELNSEVSNEIPNPTSPLNHPIASGPAVEIENNSRWPAHVSFPHRMIKAGTASTSLGTMPGEMIDKTKLFVGFLPLSINTERLIELFSPFGRIFEAIVITDRATGVSKGYGFVKYIDRLSAAKALAHMNGSRVDGKLINVRLAGRAPLKSNTVVGPRALRFAATRPVSAATRPCTFSRELNYGWNYSAFLQEPHAHFPKCNAFPSRADSMQRRTRDFNGFSEGNPFASIDLVPLGYRQRVADSPDLRRPVESLKNTFFSSTSSSELW